MGDPTPPAIPINKPFFNWESPNLHKAFKILENQAKYLLVNGQYKSCQDKDEVGAYLIGLTQSYMVFMMSLISVEESPRQMFNMYLKHLNPTSSQYSLCSRAGINLVDSTSVLSSLKQTLC